MGAHGSKILAALVAATLILPGSAAGSAEPARTAADFVDSIGVATHTSYSDTVYVRRFAELKAKLAELGVHHIREDLLPERSDQYKRLNELAAMGIGSTLIMGKPTNGVSGLKTLISVVKNNLNRVDALEGPNEWYLNGGEGWAKEVTEYQKALYTAVKSDSAISSIPVLGPSTVFWQKGELGDISQWLDYGTIHPYPDGYPSEDYLARHMEFARRSSGEKPLVATETGYHTALNYGGGHQPVSEAAMGTYMPRIFLEYFRRGVARTFAYELIDHWSNPTLDDAESNFGLLRNDLSAKPAYVALRNLIDILEDPGPAFAPAPLDYSLEGNREKLRQVLLQKHDGSFYLALWRTSSVWDPVNKVALDPGAFPVTVKFGQPVASADVYAPNSSSAPLASIPNPGASLGIDVGPEVRIMHVTPAGASSTPPPQDEAVGTPEAEPAPTVETEPTPEPEAAPEPSPAPEEESRPKKGGSRDGRARQRMRLSLWSARRSVRPGQRVVLRGRVLALSRRSIRVAIQRWDHGWHTVGRDRASNAGYFGRRIRVTRGRGSRVARLRVVAPRAAPSRPIRVRIES